jgi:hypothetical protein
VLEEERALAALSRRVRDEKRASDVTHRRARVQAAGPAVSITPRLRMELQRDEADANPLAGAAAAAPGANLVPHGPRPSSHCRAMRADQAGAGRSPVGPPADVVIERAKR